MARYSETLPVQLPEVTEKIKDYFANHYDHNNLTINKETICESIAVCVLYFRLQPFSPSAQSFVQWLEQRPIHLLSQGLKI